MGAEPPATDLATYVWNPPAADQRAPNETVDVLVFRPLNNLL